MKKLTAMLSVLALLLSVLCAFPAYAEELPVFEDPVYDIETDAYTVVYDETYTTPITTATAGTMLYFSIDGSAPQGQYFTDEYLVDGTETVTGEYIMPDHNITVSAILGQRADYTLDISDGSVKELPEKVYLFASDLLPQWEGENPDPEITLIDFNSDGSADAKITVIESEVPGEEPTYTIQLLPEAVGQLTQDCTLSPEFGPYNSIIFTLKGAPEPPQTYYTVIATAAAGGTADGGFLAAEGATARLTATPDNGYAFDGWYEGDTKVSDAANYSFTVTRNITLTAHFCTLVTRVTATGATTTYGTSKKIPVKVCDINGAPMANKTVTATINKVSYNAVTNANGIANIAPPNSLAPATYAVKVTCEGKSATCKYIVKKATPKLTAKTKTFKVANKKKYTVTLKDSKGKALKKVKVTATINGKTYAAKTNSKGKAIFKFTNLKRKGNFTAKVKFVGNKYYNAVKKSVKIKVKQ